MRRITITLAAVGVVACQPAEDRGDVAEPEASEPVAPTFATSRDNPKLQAELAKIGESNRMTLKFRKP